MLRGIDSISLPECAYIMSDWGCVFPHLAALTMSRSLQENQRAYEKDLKIVQLMVDADVFAATASDNAEVVSKLTAAPSQRITRYHQIFDERSLAAVPEESKKARDSIGGEHGEGPPIRCLMEDFGKFEGDFFRNLYCFVQRIEEQLPIDQSIHAVIVYCAGSFKDHTVAKRLKKALDQKLYNTRRPPSQHATAHPC